MRALRVAGRRWASAKLSLKQQEAALANAGNIQDRYWNEMDKSLRDALDHRAVEDREAEALDEIKRGRFDADGKPNLDHPDFARLMSRFQQVTTHAVHKPGLRHHLGVEGIQERDQHQNATIGGYADMLEAVIEDERNGEFHFAGSERGAMYPRPEQMEHMRKIGRMQRDQQKKIEDAVEKLQPPPKDVSEYYSERLEANTAWDCFDVEEFWPTIRDKIQDRYHAPVMKMMVDAIQSHPTASYMQRRQLLDGLPLEMGGASDKPKNTHRPQVKAFLQDQVQPEERLEYTFKRARFDADFVQWVRDRPELVEDIYTEDEYLDDDDEYADEVTATKD